MPTVAELRHRLAGTPATLRSVIATLPAGALTYREATGCWTPLEVLGHLTDAEVHDWIPRVRVILSDAADKRFPPFDREHGLTYYRDWSAAAVLDEFERRRRDSLATLDAFQIGDDNLARKGIHPEFGPVTLGQLLACWVTHDYAHLAQISRTLVHDVGRYAGPWRAYFSLLRDR